jgi:TolB-like protein/Flp pilus assembly protein TadD
LQQRLETEPGAYNAGMPAMTGRVAFGEFELDLETGELWKGGRILKLQPQPATVLCLLVGDAGKLVSREQIRRRLWDESTFVDYDVGVDYCVNRIRVVLGDEARSPTFIETLPRRGYRFIAPVTRTRRFAEPTLAVLPFANLNGDPATEYFADGVTAALIAELGRIPAVRVISRQSVLHLKGSRETVDAIATNLGVDGVVEGATQREGDHVSVTVQLILVDPERHAWTESYDCDMSAVLSSQRDAARAIAASVVGALTADPAGAAMSSASKAAVPVPAEIVDTFLRGVAGLGQASADGLGTALRCFREITLKAPDFAPGLAGHAVCLYCLGWFGIAPAREVYGAAKQLALQAVALDDGVSEAHHALATMYWLLDGDLPAAEREFRRATELNPSDADAHTMYALFLCGTSRYTQAVGEAQYALRLSRTSLIQNQAAAWIHLHAGDYAEAETQARRTIDLFPDAIQPHFVLGWAAWRQGQRDDAVATFERALAISREGLSLSFLAHVYARLGRTQDAGPLLEEIETLQADGRASPIAFVIAYAGLGDLPSAFSWLETACRTRIDLVWLTPGFPGIDPLRPDPRFRRLVGAMGTASI